MSSINDLLAQYTGTPVTPEIAPQQPTGVSAQMQTNVAAASPNKQESVAAASSQKQQSLGLTPDQQYGALYGQMNDVGATSASPMEQDIRTSAPLDLLLKYGPEVGSQLITGRANAGRQITADQNSFQSTDGTERIGDAIQGVGQGIINSTVGIAALGAGLVNADAGQSLSDSLTQFNNNVNANKSDNQAAGQRLVGALNQQTERENEQQYKIDQQNDGGLIAGLKNIGRNAYDAVSNTLSSGAALEDGTAQGVGSLVTAGPMAKGIKALGSAIIPTATKRGVALGAAIDTAAGNKSLVRGLAAIGEKAPILTSIGLMEAGGSYQQANSDISGMSFEDLAAQSPAFNELVKSGMTKEAARSELANRSGLMAAAIQGPIAAATGTLVSKFESNPFALQGVGSLVRNSAKETVEEGIQSATGQTAANYGKQQQALPNQELVKDVGTQLGQGALFGLTSAGLVQAPGSVANAAINAPRVAANAAIGAGKAGLNAAATVGANIIDSGLAAPVVSAVQKAADAVKGVTTPAIDWLAKRGDEVYAKMQNTSPVSDEAVKATADDVQANADASLQAAKAAVDTTNGTPEEKQATNDYLDTLAGAMSFDPEEAQGMPAPTAKAVEGATNRIDALQKMAAFANDEKNSPADRFTVMSNLNQIMTGLNDFISSGSENLKNIPADHPAYQFATGVEDLFRALEKSQALSKAQAGVQNLAENAETYGIVKPVDESTIDTAEGLQNVENQATLATVDPTRVNPNDAETILKQAKAGRIQLSPRQEAALNTAVALVRSAQDYAETSKKEGWSSSDRTAYEITANTSEGDKQSVLQHARSIYSAYSSGDLDLARDRLEHLMQFAVHMNGKVSTVNTHLSTVDDPNSKNALNYPQLRADRTFGPSKETIGVTPTSPNSVKFVRRVAGEAKFVSDVANNLAEAFPDLGVNTLDHVNLDSRLTDGDLDTVTNEFRNKTRKPGAIEETPAPTVAAEPVKTQPEQAPESSQNANVVESFKNGDKAIWANKDSDLPVTYIGNDETFKNGEVYSQVNYDGTVSYVPKSELRAAPVSTTETTETEKAPVVKAEPVVTPTVETVSEETVTPKTTTQAYPSLTVPEGGINYFHAAYNLPSTPRSRTQGHSNPLVLIRDALSSDESLAAFSGSKGQNNLTPELAKLYKELVTYSGTVAKAMNTRLQETVKANIAKAEKANKKPFLVPTNPKANRSVYGKGFNIVETNKAGLSRYNPELLQNAVLAGMQWLITSQQRQSAYDEESISKMLGISMEDAANMLEAFDTGMTTQESLQSLSEKISKYWGLAENKNMQDGFVKGIPGSIAGDLLSVFEELGLTKSTTLDYTVNAEDQVVVRQVRLLTPTIDEDAFKDLVKYPTAIDDAVLVEPEEKRFTGDERPPVAKTQMRNNTVENTPQQLQVIRKNQNTPYRLHMPMVSFFNYIGEDGIRNLFGAGDLSAQNLNVNHERTLTGRNLSYTNAFKALQDLQADLENRLGEEGGDIGKTNIYYGFNFSRVNRLQMLGAYNPQASKLVREAVLPNHVTLDMTKPVNKAAFLRGMAQAVGIKIHNMSLDAAVDKLMDDMRTKYAPAVELFYNFHSTDVLADNAIEILRDALGEPTPIAVQAMSEYARYMLAEDKTQFETPLYVEADGVTNGIANATQMLSSGNFTEDYMTNSNRTGLFFGSDRMNLNRYRTNDKTDLYQSAADDLTKQLSHLRASFKGNVPMLAQMDNLTGLMNTFLPGAKLNSEGNLEIDRGVTKNPLTITVYGSSEFGIAGNIADTLIEEIYTKMSDAAQAMADNSSLSMGQAMFGAGGDTKFAAFARYIGDLTQFQVNFSKTKGFYITEPETQKGNTESPETFTISPSEKNVMRVNIRNLFIRPMTDSITKTVGASVMQNMSSVRMATQIQSIFQEHAFKQGVDAAVQARMDADPNYAKHNMLSQNDQAKVLQSVMTKYPSISTGTQNFFIGGSNNALPTNTPIAASMDEAYRMNATVFGPTDSGVAGGAYMNIGMGDGQMIQNGYTGQGAVQHSLPVFDGVNLRLDRLAVDSQKLNTGVYDSWTQNPVREVLNSFDTLMNNVTTDDITDDMIGQLTRALTGTPKPETSVSEIMKMMEAVRKSMEVAARSIDARHEAISKFALSVDQMAAVGAPYVRGGETLPADPSAALARINEVYNAIAQKKDIPMPTAPKQEGKPVTAGVASSSGSARELSMNQVNSVIQTMSLTGTKKAMFDEIRRSTAALGYKVITGTREELMAYNEGKGMKHDQNNFTDLMVDGFISPQSKEIYIANATAQTLLHELIHASTIDAVVEHYQGNTNPEVTQAVNSLEGMMDQFMGLTLDQLSDARTRTDYQDAVASINEALTNENNDPAVRKAIALNEFMAWGLATQSLNKALAKQPILERMTKAIFDAIRKIVYGRKRVPVTPGEDILSNLMFHTGVIMRSQASARASFQDTKLYQNRRYGNSDRLVEINDAFDTSIVSYLRDSIDVLQESNRKTEATEALILGNDIANSFINHGFPMNMQEATTFSTIVSALATQAYLDPTSLNRAQELYDHVTSELNIGHFLPGNFTEQDEYNATEKFNSIMGRYLIGRDRSNRTTLLPAFLALAITNDEFRSVLNTIGLPESVKGDGTLDGTLGAYGTNALDNLSRRLAGDQDTQNVREAVDALTRTIVDTAQNRESFIDQYADAAGGIMDRANEIVADKLDSLTNKVWDTAENVKGMTSNKYINALASSAKIIAAIANEEKAALVSESVLTALNRMNGYKPLTDIITDVVGRTGSNENVYDLIKRFRTSIQQDRQQFRDSLPGIIKAKFTRELSDAEWSTLHTALGKTDIISLAQHFTMEEIHDLMKDGRNLRGKITAMENKISAADPIHWGQFQKKAQQLAYYMMGGEPGKNLLRNADAIARLLGETNGNIRKDPAFIADLDGLVSLYAIEQLNRADKDSVFSLVQSEAAGMDFVMAYLKGQRAEERRKLETNPAALFNGFKGHIPEEKDAGVNLIVAPDTQFAELTSRSMVRIADYEGSSAEPGKEKRGYYFANVASRTMFNQGLMQNVRQSANGVDVSNGFTISKMLAGRITDHATVKTITARLRAGETGEALLPVYDERGKVIAYERSVSQQEQERTNPNTNLADMIGAWRGRQVEEVKAHVYNEVLIDNLHDMYEKDLKLSAGNQASYVDIFDDKTLAGNPVLADAVTLMPRDVRAYARSKFGDSFYVRKDMLNDTFGYRDATVGDAWTGNSRWSPETLSTARRVAMGMFGANAYKYFTTAEKTVQNFVQDARTLIIVKSVVVPFANAVSNVLQLIGRGVPVRHIVSGTPRKLAEINTYVKGRVEEIQANADLLAAENDVVLQRKLKAKIQSIRDGYRRLSIWPLLEAGEFSAITDASLNSEDVELTSGRLNSFIESQVMKLPKSVRTAGRYALVTKDTALFKALEKSVEYGDFVAKAILFDDITRRQKKPTTEALAAITEEFINYDRLPGRFRGFMEKTGLLWFYNYKVRAVKVAMSTIRHNPVHALMAASLPMPSMFGSIGSPITDNLVTQMAEGGLSYSVGMGQAFNAPFLNPWVNLAY